MEDSLIRLKRRHNSKKVKSSRLIFSSFFVMLKLGVITKACSNSHRTATRAYARSTPALIAVVDSVAGVRQERSRLGRSVGFVPTMGALHEGHASLIRAAKAANERVVVSIFVNPTQFAAHEDLSKYPRPLEKDLELLEREGVDLVFTPQPSTMYPPGFSSFIDLGPSFSSGPGEGGARPHHFRGVATVCAKLLNIVKPSHAYFGQKDAMQVDGKRCA